jgi:hypothetical protein
MEDCGINSEKKTSGEYIKKESRIVYKKKSKVHRKRCNENPLAYGIPYLLRGVTSTLNKNQTKNWLQQLKQEAKQVKQEKEQNLQQLRR